MRKSNVRDKVTHGRVAAQNYRCKLMCYIISFELVMPSLLEALPVQLLSCFDCSHQHPPPSSFTQLGGLPARPSLRHAVLFMRLQHTAW